MGLAGSLGILDTGGVGGQVTDGDVFFERYIFPGGDVLESPVIHPETTVVKR